MNYSFSGGNIQKLEEIDRNKPIPQYQDGLLISDTIINPDDFAPLFNANVTSTIEHVDDFTNDEIDIDDINAEEELEF